GPRRGRPADGTDGRPRGAAGSDQLGPRPRGRHLAGGVPVVCDRDAGAGDHRVARHGRHGAAQRGARGRGPVPHGRAARRGLRHVDPGHGAHARRRRRGRRDDRRPARGLGRRRPLRPDRRREAADHAGARARHRAAGARDVPRRARL
ncbi:MAG: hypothetical protein AVDCRST_MAG67-684, partial [uncultured Solirubrobacteraceae bacterium]